MPRTIALIYVAFGAVWIFFSDRLLIWLHLDPVVITRVQTAKGWLFVVGSAIFRAGDYEEAIRKLEASASL